MSLIEPNIIDTLKRYKTYLVIGGLAVLLVGAALFLYSCGDDYLFKSKVQKDKEAIANTAQEIANVSKEIANLQLQKEGLKANLNTATEQLHKDVFGHEEAKKESNQALANLQKAIETNSNVDRTVEDLNRALERLEQ